MDGWHGQYNRGTRRGAAARGPGARPKHRARRRPALPQLRGRRRDNTAVSDPRIIAAHPKLRRCLTRLPYHLTHDEQAARHAPSDPSRTEAGPRVTRPRVWCFRRQISEKRIFVVRVPNPGPVDAQSGYWKPPPPPTNTMGKAC